jgi:hypothetical protein
VSGGGAGDRRSLGGCGGAESVRAAVRVADLVGHFWLVMIRPSKAKAPFPVICPVLSTSTSRVQIHDNQMRPHHRRILVREVLLSQFHDRRVASLPPTAPLGKSSPLGRCCIGIRDQAAEDERTMQFVGLLLRVVRSERLQSGSQIPEKCGERIGVVYTGVPENACGDRTWRPVAESVSHPDWSGEWGRCLRDVAAPA